MKKVVKLNEFGSSLAAARNRPLVMFAYGAISAADASKTAQDVGTGRGLRLARIFHESLAATADLPVLPGVRGPRTLRRTEKVRLRFEPLRLPGGTVIFAVSRHQFMKHPG
jgi:hypothetical protein